MLGPIGRSTVCPNSVTTWRIALAHTPGEAVEPHNDRVAAGGALRRPVAVMVLVAVVSALAAFHLADRAGAEQTRCERHRSDSRERSVIVTGQGTGPRTLVIGDSWSVGLRLDDLARSWPSRLPQEVRVAGFSGSGFSSRASGCGRVSFADRAPSALISRPAVVLAAGGLNDHDQPSAAIENGFRTLMQDLGGQRVVVIGPASAPARAHAVPRLDALLSALCEEYAVPYVATSDLDLPFLPDGLHLTEAGHDSFGATVASRLLDVTAARPRVLTNLTT